MVDGFDKQLGSAYDIIVNGPAQRAPGSMTMAPRAGGFKPVGPLFRARPGGQPPSRIASPTPPEPHPTARPRKSPTGGIIKPKRACYFHNHGGCSKTDELCSHEHVLLPEVERSKMVKPSPKGSRSPTGGREGRSPGPGEPGLSGAGGLCRFFITGSCKKGDDCRYTHVPDTERARVEKARASTSPPPLPTQAVATPQRSNLVAQPTLVGPRLAPAATTTRKSNWAAQPTVTGPRFFNLAKNDGE